MANQQTDLMRLENLLRQGRFVEAAILFETSDVSVAKYHPISERYPREVSRPNIVRVLGEFNFEFADTLAAEITDDDIRRRYEELRASFRDDYKRRREEIIEDALSNFKFELADLLAREITREGFRAHYDSLRASYKKKQEEKLEQENILKKVDVLLVGRNFSEADNVFYNQSVVDTDTYVKKRATVLGKWFQNEWGVSFDDQQKTALAVLPHNTLIRARAGSGKTRVLAGKAVQLMQTYNVEPDSLVILAFNVKAAGEIGDRIRKAMRMPEFHNARTFHSLAFQISQPSKKILDDGREFEHRASLSSFITETIREIWNPIFQEKLADNFKKELTEFVNFRSLLSDHDYRVYIQNRRDITLGGDYVKSKGEKFVADFLFEHGIRYAYEKVFWWDKRTYRPDFFIWQGKHKVVLEHWGIDPEKSHEEGRGSFLDDQKYLKSVNDKRRYWEDKDKSVIFLETKVTDLSNGRQAFEGKLKQMLEAAGLICNRLPDKEIEDNLFRKQKSRITKLFSQLISRAKKYGIAPDDLEKLLREKRSNLDERTYTFLELGTEVYRHYEEKKTRENKIDFDDLIANAVSRVHETSGEVPIYVNNKKIPVKQLQWFLIDEFQDFSPLFFRLVASIAKYATDPRFVCVGDDWQAINGFAGSTLKYFSSFGEFFSDSQLVNLSTNYRSNRVIVNVSNRLMERYGPKAEASIDGGGNVEVINVNNVYIDARNSNGRVESADEDKKFIFSREIDGNSYLDPHGRIKAQYLKQCYLIVRGLIDRKEAKKIAILSRRNTLYFTELNEFLSRLRSCFTTDERKQFLSDQQITIGSVHSFKGLEANVVIILECCEGAFPLLHPDSELFFPLGVTPQELLDEERRLFYVALTRAKDKLYLLTQQGRESVFLKELGITPVKSGLASEFL